jgi:hypothetical protein
VGKFSKHDRPIDEHICQCCAVFDFVSNPWFWVFEILEFYFLIQNFFAKPLLMCISKT